MRALNISMATLALVLALPSAALAIDDGTHVVGTDVEAGTYRAGGGDGCHWARLSGFGGEASDVIASDDSTGPAVVTIEPTDAGFRTRACGTWEVVEAVVPPTAVPVDPSTAGPHGILLAGQELYSNTRSLDVPVKRFVDRWNSGVKGQGRAHQIRNVPGVQVDEDGGEYIDFFHGPDAGPNDSSTLLVRAVLQDGRVQAAGLLWLPLDGDDLERSDDRRNAIIEFGAFTEALGPDVASGDALMAELGWSDDVESFAGVESQLTVGDVTFTFVGYEDDIGEELVWVIARAADGSGEPSS